MCNGVCINNEKRLLVVVLPFERDTVKEASNSNSSTCFFVCVSSCMKPNCSTNYSTGLSVSDYDVVRGQVFR